MWGNRLFTIDSIEFNGKSGKSDGKIINLKRDLYDGKTTG